jgi:hypothetical protein
VMNTSPRQTPGKWSYKQQGDIVIALNPRPAEPEPPPALPTELQQAVTSPFAGVREGVVRELETLLRGADKGMAFAAQAALQVLSEDDSRRVSSAALQALTTFEPRGREILLPPPQPSIVPVPTSAVATLDPHAEAIPPVPNATEPSIRSDPLRRVPLRSIVSLGLGILLIAAGIYGFNQWRAGNAAVANDHTTTTDETSETPLHTDETSETPLHTDETSETPLHTDESLTPADIVAFNLENYGQNNPANRIVFASNRDDNTEIYMMDADGSNQTRLTDLTAWNTSPSWSWGGESVYFASDRTQNWEIFVLRVNGSGLLQLTDSLEASYTPVLSPDGGNIVYALGSDETSELWMMNAGGSEPSQLTYLEQRSVNPAIAPDQSRVIFESYPEGGEDADLYEVIFYTGEVRNLTDTPSINETAPAWSPDGSRVAFTSDHDIYVVDADGNNLEQLTDDPAFDENPVWSPDGTQIAFSTNRDGNYEIYVMNADGTNPVNLTNHPSDDVEPDW